MRKQPWNTFNQTQLAWSQLVLGQPIPARCPAGPKLQQRSSRAADVVAWPCGRSKHSHSQRRQQGQTQSNVAIVSVGLACNLQSACRKCNPILHTAHHIDNTMQYISPSAMPVLPSTATWRPAYVPACLVLKSRLPSPLPPHLQWAQLCSRNLYRAYNVRTDIRTLPGPRYVT